MTTKIPVLGRRRQQSPTQDTKKPPGQDKRPAADEPAQRARAPINLADKRKEDYLYRNGYAQKADGLYLSRQEENKKDAKIIDVQADILTRRVIKTVPDRLDQSPAAYDTVLLARLSGAGGTQELSIFQSDMQSTKPDFLGQLSASTPPHKRRREDFIHALGVLSFYDMVKVEEAYNASGLVQSPKGLVFLNPSGAALTPGGMEESYSVQFPQKIEGGLAALPYGWKRASAASERVSDFKTLLKLLAIAPGRPGYGDVLVGTGAFCPFSQVCETGGVWSVIHGGTGSFKSATSRIPLQWYAQTSGRQETSTVTLRDGIGTIFGIEQALYYLGGMFAHVDDALKGMNVEQKDVKAFFKMLSAICGHTVDRQGGTRGTWNQGRGGFGITAYPRGSGVWTVEKLPDSENFASDLARCIVISLDSAESIDVPLLTELQEKHAAEAMNRATASYIQWLLPRLGDYLATIPEREEAYRVLGVHTRIPTSYAKVETGIAALLDYGVSIGALTGEDAALLLAESRERLQAVALSQTALMGIDEQKKQANSDVVLFYMLVRQAFRSHKVYASDAALREVPEGHRPKPPGCLDTLGDFAEVWGWKYNEHKERFEPGASAQEAGVLKNTPGLPLALHMYARDFSAVIYPILHKLGSEQNTPLPGLPDMLEKLRKAGKLHSTVNQTNLHGRGSYKGICYILDMSQADEPAQDNLQNEPIAISDEKEEVYI
jgi:hypothetical protein